MTHPNAAQVGLRAQAHALLFFAALVLVAAMVACQVRGAS